MTKYKTAYRVLDRHFSLIEIKEEKGLDENPFCVVSYLHVCIWRQIANEAKGGLNNANEGNGDPRTKKGISTERGAEQVTRRIRETEAREDSRKMPMPKIDAVMVAICNTGHGAKRKEK
ncbi:hypothetical protein N7453_002589 [Penicillium expansum]|nr:hypothetical protein N7453_002589 [Penicillium expansum]